MHAALNGLCFENIDVVPMNISGVTWNRLVGVIVVCLLAGCYLIAENSRWPAGALLRTLRHKTEVWIPAGLREYSIISESKTSCMTRLAG